jgi:hypothetical protein
MPDRGHSDSTLNRYLYHMYKTICSLLFLKC